MRVVSWLVVVSSVAALSWLGLSSRLTGLDLPGMEADHAVGTMLANTARASVEVAQEEGAEATCNQGFEEEAGVRKNADPAKPKPVPKTTDDRCPEE